MSLGLLDLPAPLFDAVDALLRTLHLPDVVRIVLYAVASAWLSMWLYRRCSDQNRLADLHQEIRRTQREMAAHEGEFAELNRLIRRNLALTLRHLALTLRPALLASFPLLFVLPWLSNAFSVAAPAASLHVCAEPAAAAPQVHWTAQARDAGEGCWDVDTTPDARATLQDTRGTPLLTLPQTPQSTIIHKFATFNWLIGNPDGYLPTDAPLERLALQLQAREVVAFGPAWMRGWEALYFAVLMIVSVLLKVRWKIR